MSDLKKMKTYLELLRNTKRGISVIKMGRFGFESALTDFVVMENNGDVGLL